MDKNGIGTNAGKVWMLLSDNSRWTYDDLKKKSGLNDMELSSAIGWLAREDKIEFETAQGDSFLFLGVNVYIG